LFVSALLIGCTGPTGPAGTLGANGPTGPAGSDGTAGQNGASGANGAACWDTNANGLCDLATEDSNSDGVCTIADCRGAPGLGTVNLEPNGLVGFVRDTARLPVVGAKVYLVPNGDIPTAALALTDINVERASTVDEPLEDTIDKNGAGYMQAATDVNGIYDIPMVAAGRYFVVVVPADSGHLPGGDSCRTSRPHTALVGKQLDIVVSTAPSATAEYVGPSVCLTCHGVVHEKQTLHMLGIRKIGQTGPLQDSSRFPGWNTPLAKFKDSADQTPTDATTLYYYAYNNNSASPDWKLSEVDPGAGVSFVAKLFRYANKYWVKLIDLKGASGEKLYEVELSYGGGLYKQRYAVKIGGSRYILPIQYNFEGQSDETQPYVRWRWQQYNAQNWYDEATPKLKEPAKTKAFDNSCAGCHFSGFSLTGDATSGFAAHGVPDPNGELDFDGDGKLESMNITCETCHGPGSDHWLWAGQGRAIVSPRLLTPEREVAICAQCHTRALGVGGGATEAPMNASGVMMRAGDRRSVFLLNHVSKLDDGMWDAVKGDGKHSKKHHQQASDFLKAKKYRNPYDLLTCSSCHDPHGNADVPHQLWSAPDDSTLGESLCMGCHSPYYPPGNTLALRMEAHWTAQGIAGIPMSTPALPIGCIDCHMPKTAKSGSGLKQATIQGVTYYSGDISSHLFDVPLRTSIATKAADMMAIPYTSQCGQCHTNAP
jgi:hypothetical protein